MAVTIDVVCLLGVYSHDAYHQAGREPKCKLLFHANYLITAEKIINNALGAPNLQATENDHASSPCFSDVYTAVFSP